MAKSLAIDIDYLDIDASQLLAEIQNRCFDTKWQARDFQTLCRSAGVITQIASVGSKTGKRPIAFGLYRTVATEAEILSLAVLAEFRNQAVALKMLQNIFVRFSALKVSRVFLEVASDNGPAISLYTKAGFNSVGLRKNYYRHKNGATDALILSKNLV